MAGRFSETMTRDAVQEPRWYPDGPMRANVLAPEPLSGGDVNARCRSGTCG
jgi:hypothetical protein